MSVSLRTSMLTGRPHRLGGEALAPAAVDGGGSGMVLLVPAAVGVHDGPDQAVPDDVLGGQLGEVHVLDAVEDVLTTRRPDRVPPGRSTWVTSPVTTIFEPKPRRVR